MNKSIQFLTRVSEYFFVTCLLFFIRSFIFTENMVGLPYHLLKLTEAALSADVLRHQFSENLRKFQGNVKGNNVGDRRDESRPNKTSNLSFIHFMSVSFF